MLRIINISIFIKDNGTQYTAFSRARRMVIGYGGIILRDA